MPTPSLAELTAAVFPHSVRNVSVCETHLSLVVLTGDLAYKIKKTLRLDFIDSSTLERRRELCLEEVRLNRRYAPELYLDTVPIAREAGRLHFGGTGTPIEYAVQMRQFDRRQELESLLDAKSIVPADMYGLAERIAVFHRGTSVLREPGDPGTGLFVDKARENVANVVERSALLDAASMSAELRDWTESTLADLRDRLREREQQGFVRECHGDLHARNVVRWRGELVPFDCIEFDPALRFIDVLNDVAFLAMDLCNRGRRDLSFALLNRYLERTGDYLGADLLPCYLVYRALVRAKVSLIELEQRNDAADASERASSLLRTAARFARSAAPVLIVMYGASGSGKSWLSERLVPELPALRIRSDLERKRLAGIDPMAPHTAGMDQGIYTLEFNDRTYSHLLDCARACLRGKVNTIVDAAFLKFEERRRFASLAAEEGAEFLILSCGADRDTLAARIEARRAARRDPSGADLDVLQRQLGTIQPLGESEAAHTLQVDTRTPDVERTVLEHLTAQTT